MTIWQSIQSVAYGAFDEPKDHWQWITVAACFIVAALLGFLLKRYQRKSGSHRFLPPSLDSGNPTQTIPLAFCLLLWLVWAIRDQWSSGLFNQTPTPLPSEHIHTVALLVSAYVIHQLTKTVTKSSLVPRLLSGFVLFLFTLHLLAWLDPVIEALRNISLPLGDWEINLWNLSTGVISLVILMWFVRLANRFIDTTINSRPEIPPSAKVLISKACRLSLYALACIGALAIAGVPLGGLTIFSGALGLGLGFGLQKIIANLISGLIILVDKSIKPGDVIEIDGTFGWINSIHTRYVSVVTRDRKEYLIPNEDFVTNKVVNWSYSDRIVRIKADIGVSYDTDLPQAMKLCTAAVATAPRALTHPEPVCLLKEFGDSSILLQIRFCIDDATHGVSNVRSEVLLAIWQSFRENQIEIPFPQRDIHIKSTPANLSPAQAVQS